MKKFGDRAHVAVNGQHVRKTGEGGAEAAVQFRALAVDDVGLDFMQSFFCRTNAALIECAHPADFRDVQAVKKYV